MRHNPAKYVRVASVLRFVEVLACKLWGHRPQEQVRQAGNLDVAVTACSRCGRYTITLVR